MGRAARCNWATKRLYQPSYHGTSENGGSQCGATRQGLRYNTQVSERFGNNNLRRCLQRRDSAAARKQVCCVGVRAVDGDRPEIGAGDRAEIAMVNGGPRVDRPAAIVKVPQTVAKGGERRKGRWGTAPRVAGIEQGRKRGGGRGHVAGEANRGGALNVSPGRAADDGIRARAGEYGSMPAAAV